MVYNIYNSAVSSVDYSYFIAVAYGVSYMKLLECFDKRLFAHYGRYVPKNKFYVVKGNPTKTRKGYRSQYYIKGEKTNNEWSIAFLSYDKLGLVFKPKNSNRWCFTGCVNRCTPVYNRGLHWHSKGWNQYEFNLLSGIHKEKKVKEDLKKVFDKPFNVYLLYRSGANCHGSDIIITLFDNSDFTEYQLRNENRFNYVVCSSLCAIEVFGVTYRGKNKDIPYFNNANKDMLNYMKELEDNNVLPFIAWIIEGKVWYMPLTSETVNVVFFTNRGGKYRQIRNYASVSSADGFKMDKNALYSYIISKKAI